MTESANSRAYVAGWLRQNPEFMAELGIKDSFDLASRLRWLGSGGRADAVLLKLPADYPEAELRGRQVVLKVTNDRAQAMMSQAAMEDEPLGVVTVYDVVESDAAPRASLPELPPKGQKAFYVAQTWGVLEKLVVPLEAARQLVGVTIAGEDVDELLARYAATWRAYEAGGRASDPLVEEWRLQYAAAIEWIEDTCEAIGSPPLPDLHEGNWGVDPDSGDLVLLDLGQCYVPPPARMSANPAPKLEEGVTVVVERHPLYDHGTGHVPAHKTTRKRVKSVQWHAPDHATVRLRGSRMRVGGSSIDRPFRMEGSDHSGWWLTSGPPGPLRYLIVGVEP